MLDGLPCLSFPRYLEHSNTYLINFIIPSTLSGSSVAFAETKLLKCHSKCISGVTRRQF